MSVLVRQATRGEPIELVLRLAREQFEHIDLTDADIGHLVCYEPVSISVAAQLVADLSAILAGECKNW
jgi:hypothetical protein